MMYFDPLYLIMLLPGLVLAGIASLLVKTTFSRYSKVRSYSGFTGAQAAERMMRSNGIFDVKVEETQGFLSDHYDPSKKVLRLSPGVYESTSLAAVGVACHEAGHAMQHASQYAPSVVAALSLFPASEQRVALLAAADVAAGAALAPDYAAICASEDAHWSGRGVCARADGSTGPCW